ncbi:glutamine-rich protein 2-like isoform X2 [Bombus pyrosoma]|uniref:glutamine-rich protein 2-like isoform X2 n=1 Tax=Bombus pyrosoma TaxID=396416 RepID=UPI001CB8CE37|nr:glutamine-rich protein 2-like isoform X2 [Bombus pyrosoma]
MSAKVAKSPTSPPVAKEVDSLQVSLPQMLDLALGTPEVGAVNLNILHNFLHILLHRINLGSTKVEYRGDDANRIKTMVSSLKAGPSLYLQEYNIIDDSSDVKQRVRSTDAISVKVDVVSDAKDEASQDTVDLKETTGVRKQVGPGKEGKCETVIFVEPIVDGATPTALGFKRLEKNVNELQQRFQALEELATTPELIERLKGKITDPLTDVWQIISITKRLDASEQGIDKLTKMVQDVMKGDATLATEDTSKLEERLVNLENALNNLDHVVQNLQLIADDGEVEGIQNPVVAETTGEEEEEAQLVQEEKQPVRRITLSEILGEIDIRKMHQDVGNLQMEVSQMKNQLKDLNEKIDKTKAELTEEMEAKQLTTQRERNPAERTQEEETEETTKEITTSHKSTPSELRTQVRNPKEMIDSEELQDMRKRISKLEKDVINISDKVDKIQVIGVAGATNIDNLVSKYNEVQAEMEKLNQTADRLIDDRETREMHLNALLEQVELLKTIKADREDLEEALADKADAQAIHRKVSYDQFDAACDDLAHGLEDAINKLGQQEEIWQQALDEVQKEIEGKVDKMEISPLKDFVNHRLKSLQDKLKRVAEARQDIEAAGTKKMLRDVQCISCDKDVVMRMDPPHKFKVETLPCTTSMKPYLTYELDQVRKQHRRLPHSRNMIQFEAAMQEEAKKQKSARADTLVKTPRDHLCNRYCGGSHTITTPQQRVMRVGHFLTEWGPEIIQLTEGMIKGTDGKMYKGRRMPDKIDVCGPAYCDERGDELRSSVIIRSPHVFFSFENNKGKRSSRRQSREMTKEVIEELAETPRTETEDQSDRSVSAPMDTVEPIDHVVQYIDEEELGEQD